MTTTLSQLSYESNLKKLVEQNKKLNDDARRRVTDRLNRAFDLPPNCTKLTTRKGYGGKAGDVVTICCGEIDSCMDKWVQPEMFEELWADYGVEELDSISLSDVVVRA